MAPDPRQLAAQQRADAAARVRWSISVNGKTVDFVLSEMTAREYQALERGPGWSIGEIWDGCTRGQLDRLAAAWWLARRQAGEKTLDWDTLLDEVSWGDVIVFGDTDLADGEEPAGHGHPEG